MIRFFQHIQKTLMEQNKIGKYLLYAIGEIFLVVIGILIALQVNNWNEQRIQEQIEKGLLFDLLVDLEETRSDLITDIAKTESMMEFTDSLYISMYGGKYFEGQEKVTIPLEFIFTRGSLYPKISAYQSIQSVGINIIQNDSLRIMITEFYELALKRSTDHEQIFVRIRNEQLIPLIYKEFKNGNYCKDCKSLEDLWNNGDGLQTNYLIPGESTEELKTILKNIYESLYSLRSRYLQLDQEIQHLTTSIQEYVD